MPTDFWFRFSTYLSLALSCACLGYAEWDLLPAISFLATFVILFLVASFLLDRRFELGLGKANLLGLVIGIGAALWMVYCVTSPSKTGALAQIGWPTSLLPAVAPVLMVLIPAKLLRPLHVGDWWAMHGVALAAVGLASAMNDDVTFVVLLTVYGIVAAWSLVLFFYRRGGGFVPPIPNRPIQPPPQVLDPDLTGRGPRWMFARSTLWLILAGVLALPLYFTLPRPNGTPWLITKQIYEVGQSTEVSVDITHGGTLQKSDEIAYFLYVTHGNGEPKDDLPADQLWRARALCEYKDGAWSRPTTVPVILARFPPARTSVVASVATPKDFGPDGYQVQFIPTDKERFAIVSFPCGGAGNKTPLAWAALGGGWQRSSDMSYIPSPPGGRLGEYRQACPPATADGLDMPFEVIGQTEIGQLLRKLQTSTRGTIVKQYAAELLDRLIQEGKLPTSARLLNDPWSLTAPEAHERIARLFSDHLTTSGLFTYSTTIAYQNKQMDPIEDFLQNTRTGNCELFASALVLLLRAVDVPAQYITGYKGWDTNEGGNLVIRRRQAHAWVEVLVSRPAPADFVFSPATLPEKQKVVWHWLALDPTTSDATDDAKATTKNWLGSSTSLLFSFVIGYDKEKQIQAIQEGRNFLLRYGPALVGGLAVLGGSWWAYRRWRRVPLRPIVTSDGPGWYVRMVQALDAIGVRLQSGETPREFAERASALLAEQGLTGADVPPFVTSKLYRVRYAGLTLDAAELQTIVDAVTRLELAVPKVNPGSPA
jgi:protein-glutamine gamma-glutamyltransferase